MNKLFSKIAGLSIGLAMAIGVGVAVGSGSKDVKSVSAANDTLAMSALSSSDSNISAVAAKSTGQNAPITATVNSQAGIRMYANNTLTITSSQNITSLTIPWYKNGSKTFASVTANVGTYTHASSSGNSGTWTGSAKEIVLKVGSSGQIQTYQIQYVTAAAKTLSSISVSDSHRSFTVGDTFVKETVTAHYSDSSSATVTDTASFTGYNMSSAGNQTVTVSYTEGGVEKTATYGITVTAATTPTISLSGSSFSGYTGQNFSVTATYSNLNSAFAWATSGSGTTTETITSTGTTTDGTSTYSGTLTGAGTKTLTATGGGVSPSPTYTVTIDQVTVDITKASTSIPVGRSETLAATHNASSVGGLSWTSNNAKVSVDSDGKVTVANDATVGSTATITATSLVDGDVSDTCTVTVAEAPLEYEVVFGTAEGTSGISDFSNTSIVCPSEVTLDNIVGNVYGSTTDAKVALRFGKSGTTGSFDASIAGNYYITSVKCNLKYYGSDTTATFSVTPDGGEAISKTMTSDWADYTYDVSAAKVKKVTLGTDINGKRAFLSGFTITYAEARVLSNISLSGTYPTSFTKGDAFSHSGMVVTANYSDSTSSVVTDSATWSSPDMSTSGEKIITVSYSDEYGSASKNYTITVEYANPTGIVLSQNTKRLALLEEFDVSTIDVTINPEATVDQSLYEWIVQDSDGLVEGETYEFKDGVFYAMEPADAVILRCQSTKEGYAATVYADVTVEVTGDPIAHLLDNELADVTDGSASVFADAGTLSYAVTTENFEGTMSYAWSTSASSIISIDNDQGDMCDFCVEGVVGSARLSCRIQGSTKGDVTVYVDVTVSAVTVTSVTWNAPTINVYSGAALSTTGWNVRYSTDSGKTDVPADSFDILLGGSVVSSGYEFAATDDGKTLAVRVGNTVSETSTTVSVTQTINQVLAPVPGEEATSTLTFAEKYATGGATSSGGEEWVVESDGTESNFDTTKGIHYGTGSASVQYIKLTTDDFASGTITKVVVNASTASGVSATAGVTVGGDQFGGEPQSLSSSAANYNFEGNAAADEIVVTITKPSSATKAIYCLSIAVTYATESGESINIANAVGHEVAQKAVVKFANAFNDAVATGSSCSTEPGQSGTTPAWDLCQTAYDEFLEDAASDLAYAKNLIRYATKEYSDSSDKACVERMVTTYKILVGRGYTAFMSEIVSAGKTINPLQLSVKNSSAVITVVAISALSLAAVGGYFLFRRRKEQ